jgi:uncharacterized cupredoxin-like copper-binding protein
MSKEARMRKVTFVVVLGALVAFPACSRGTKTAAPGGFGTIAALPTTSAAPSAAPGPINVSLGEASTSMMFIHLSSATAPSGKVTFFVHNEGNSTHEFVVLQTDTPAANFPIGSFEGESDRIDEDGVGSNVGETGDLMPGATKALTIDLAPGHYAVVCNLPGHYRMGMHQDFTVQ